MNGVSELCSFKRTKSCQSKSKTTNQLGSKSKESIAFTANQKRKGTIFSNCSIGILISFSTSSGMLEN